MGSLLSIFKPKKRAGMEFGLDPIEFEVSALNPMRQRSME